MIKEVLSERVKEKVFPKAFSRVLRKIRKELLKEGLVISKNGDTFGICGREEKKPRRKFLVVGSISSGIMEVYDSAVWEDAESVAEEWEGEIRQILKNPHYGNIITLARDFI